MSGTYPEVSVMKNIETANFEDTDRSGSGGAILNGLFPS